MSSTKMTMPRRVLLLLSFLLLHPRCECHTHAPVGVHLSLGTNDDEMVVTWMTHKATLFSTVEYDVADVTGIGGGSNGDEPLSLRTNGTQQEFVDGGPEKSVRYMHVVVLRDLEPGVKYVYRVGGHSTEPYHWSATFFFFAKRSPSQISAGPPLRMITVCDVGIQESGGLLELIAAEVRRGANASSSSSSSDDDDVDDDDDASRALFPDVLVQCGDFAYDLDTDDGKNGDEWMDKVQPIAAYVPYMTSAGNHERAYNFSHYAARFNMPGNGRVTDNHYYSFDVGPVHVVAYNSEAFFWPEHFNLDYMRRMYRWLEDDLRAANQNREAVPWIVVHAHRPMYCVDADKPDWHGLVSTQAPPHRTSLP